MDKNIIKKFRDRINENGFVLRKYKNKDNKNKFNCICSAMDWIDVNINYLNSDRVLNLSDNQDINSIEIYTFISCIDTIWDAIQQLHRVFICEESVPYENSKNIFWNKEKSDNEYFKDIRAMFGAHPVNLKDKYYSKNSVIRFASWSQYVGDNKFNIVIYSNVIGDNDKIVSIDINDLWDFVKYRYDYLNTIIDKINFMEKEEIELLKRTEIKKTKDIIKQIDILIEESTLRTNNCYIDELETLKIIFCTTITDAKNLNLVDNYKSILLCVVDEIYNNLQNMNIDSLKTSQYINYFPKNGTIRYYFNKLIDQVFGNSNYSLFEYECLKKYISSKINIGSIQSNNELFVLIQTYEYLNSIN